jgi:exoribonuclease R
LFSYDSWDTKHPYGLLDETIGDVNLLTNTSRYLLHCNDLVYSHKKIQKKIGKIDYDTTLKDIVEKYNIEPFEHKHIFSIDPQGSKDLDDAMSIDKVSETKYIVRIYIANVLLWIDYLDLWEELTNQPSTIYLPNEKKSMLPNLLGDQFCSLLEKQKKMVQVFEFCIENNNVNKAESKIYNALVTIKKNYVYDEPNMQSNKHYLLLQELSQNITSNQMDSHEVVSYWMVEANKWMAETLHNNEKGIYRTAHYSELPPDVSLEHKDVIQTYLHTHSQYMLYKHDGLTHSVMREDKYVHVTSPIRRMVDICNQYYFQLITNNEVSLNAILFMNTREDMIDDMNATLKKIKKVQNQMNLLSSIETHNIDLNKEFNGVIIDKEIGGEYNEYQVFISELSLFQQVRSNEIKEIYDDVFVKMYYLQDEYITYKKIRCQMI